MADDTQALPVFDASQPFLAVPSAAENAPQFDPGKPFQPVAAPAPTKLDPATATAAHKSALDYFDDVMRSVANGATFGYADTIAAKANQLLGTSFGQDQPSGTYADNLAAQRARDQTIPGAIKIPGEVTGAVGSTIATAPEAGAVAALTGISKLPGFARAAIGGATGGALFGSGEAEPGLENRLKGGAGGAIVGGATGAALYPVIEAGAALSRWMRPQSQAASQLGRALARDQMTPGDLVTAATDLQADRPGVATLADAGGENVQGLLERIAQTPGAGRTVVVPALTDKQKMQAGRIAIDLSMLTGSPRGAIDAVNETIAQRAEAATPLYQSAMDFNARAVPEVVDAFNREVSTGFGQDLLRSKEFKNTLQTEYGIKDPTQAPLMVVIDAWKKAADDLGRSLAKNGSTNSARVVGDMTRRVVSVVDQYNPAYANARAAWAGPTQYLDALENGRGFANATSDQVRSALTDYSPSEQEAYKIGALSSVFSKIGRDPSLMPDATKYLRSPEMRDKVAALMPTPDAAEAWRRRLDYEIASAGLAKRALGNSATARRQAELDDADGLSHAAGVVSDLMGDAFYGMPPISLLQRFITALPDKARDTVRSKADLALAQLLTDPNAVGSAQMARVLAGAGPYLNPPSALRGALPANAIAAARDQQ